MDEALVFGAKDCKLESCQDSICYWHAGGKAKKSNAETRDRAGDLQIFSLTLSQLSYSGHVQELAQ